eukprot:3921436-Pyramimonas_sp.AAC.1
MVDRSTVTVDVTTRAVLMRLLGSMRFDEEFGGYATFQEVRELNLRSGFRIIEKGPVTDIHRLHELVPPVRLTFFNNRAGVGLNL